MQTIILLSITCKLFLDFAATLEFKAMRLKIISLVLTKAHPPSKYRAFVKSILPLERNLHLLRGDLLLQGRELVIVTVRKIEKIFI